MSNIEYDLDTSGGLMPQVQALIAPPISEEAAKNKKNEKSEHPYFKRPGKGHNHDSCDACSEGGDLICCDKCPASFHLTCHDPPLEEKDIPTGQWLCHHCRKTKELSLEKNNPHIRNKRSNSSTSLKESRECISNLHCPFKNKKPKFSPMDVLIKAASLMNPKQFELPRNMNVPYSFPGTDKVESYLAGNNRSKQRNVNSNTSFSSGSNNTFSNSKFSKQKSSGYELTNGLVPLPARTCFECKRSCRVGPLLACDYCPLLFHLDCLDPPLTALPAGRWMCPNHIEQYIDSKLVTSVSATERIRLWDQFSGPVDQDAVKMEFFRKIHCKNPPFRVKVHLGTRKRVSVPAMVRNHYKHPVPLLPSLKDVLRLETVANRGREYLEYVTALYVSAAATCNKSSTTETSNINLQPIEDSTDKINNGQIELDSDTNDLFNCAKLVSIKKDNDNVEDNKSEIELNETIVENEQIVTIVEPKYNGQPQGIKDNSLTNESVDIKLENTKVINNGDCNGISNSLDNINYAQNFINNNNKTSNIAIQTSNKISDIISGPVLHADIERELQQLDDRLIRLLAYQRIQHLLSHQQLQQYDISQNFIGNNSRQMPLPSELLTPADIDRISRVFTSPKRTKTRSRSTLRARAMLCPVVSKHFYNVRTSEVDPSQVRHDASFMGFRPTVSARFPEAAAMRYRSLTIGRGSANDVELERFGYCNYTSPKHAVIFYDECTKHYELINYSEFGTQVNNVLYCCDFSDKSTIHRSKIYEEQQNNGKTTNFIATVREIVDKKRKIQRKSREHSIEARMTAVADGYDNLECQCGTNPPSAAIATSESDGSGIGSTVSSLNGWEGAAVLGHGALLRFGCITFVFSIVECATV